MSRSAAIVGVGCVTHAGIGFEAFQSALSIRRTAENPAYAPPQAELEPLLPDLGYPRPPRSSMMSLVAAREAWAQAKGEGAVSPDEFGLILNRNHGQHATVERYLGKVWETGPGSASGLVFVQTIANTVLGFLALKFEARGPSELLFGPPAIGLGLDLIRAGKATALLCGGLDEYSDFSIAMDACWNQIDFLPGEAAAFLALEQPEHAKERGQPTLGYLRGYDLRFDRLGRHDPSTRDPKSLTDVIHRALADSEIEAQEIGLVSLSGGGGLKEIDAAESEAVAAIFGARVETMATKATAGDASGAAAGVAALGALSWLEESQGRAALALTTDISGLNGAYVIAREDFL